MKYILKSGKLFVLAWLLLAGAAAHSASSGALTVAVYGFTDADKKGGGYGGKVTALVTANLTTESNLVMVERSNLKKALGEQALGVSGMVNSETAAKIGRLTGAKVLVSGQVIKTGSKRLLIVANIVGTETGRLFSEKAEGASENLSDLTSEISRKVAQNIRDHTSSFVTETQSHEEYLERIVKSIKGTNRPSVSVAFRFPSHAAHSTADTEMSIILQKAGFKVVDGHSEQKPDVEVTGVAASETSPQRDGLYSGHTVIELKVGDRRTGKIIAIDRQAGDAVDIGNNTVWRSSTVNAVDALAERLLPLLAQ